MKNRKKKEFNAVEKLFTHTRNTITSPKKNTPVLRETTNFKEPWNPDDPKYIYRRKVCSLLTLFFLFFSAFSIFSQYSSSLTSFDDVSSVLPNFDQPFTPKNYQTFNKSKEILVLGFHHSGTSIVAKMLMYLGIYGGDSTDMVMLPYNKLKYNELRLAVDANKEVFREIRGHKENFVAKHGPWWLGYGFDMGFLSDKGLREFKSKVEGIVKEVRRKGKEEGKGSWMIKDPRLCLLSDYYFQEMDPEKSMCLIVWREPAEVALRMLSYNSNKERLSVREYVELWELYMKTAINSCVKRDLPIVYLPFELTSNPVLLAEVLGQKFGVDVDLRKESIEEYFGINIDGMKEKNLVRKLLSHSENDDIAQMKAISSPDTNILSPLTEEILNILRSEKAKLITSEYKLSVPNAEYEHKVQSVSKEGYATLISSNDLGYISGAVVLYLSISRFDSYRPFYFLLSEEVDEKYIRDVFKKFKFRGANIVKVPKLREAWYNNKKYPQCSKDKFSSTQKVRWGRMFSKLNVFNPKNTGMEKLIYLDTDTIVLRPLDNWFNILNKQKGDIFFAERSPSHQGFNAGILVLLTGDEVFQQLLDYGEENPPMKFWPTNQVGCTEQELLNRFFGKKKLNLTRHADNLSSRFGQEVITNGARAAHWLTKKCPKPWTVAPFDVDYAANRGELRKFGGRGIPKMCDPTVFKIWHHYYWSTIAAENVQSFKSTDDDNIRGIQYFSLHEILRGKKEVKDALK
eukprot:snap_masked-scaffold_17-processed-gene-2.27-mRNA-1 protein AED:1.00 eAED:1.00 QI:0/0/0/0/1/1/2/0/740